MLYLRIIFGFIDMFYLIFQQINPNLGMGWGDGKSCNPGIFQHSVTFC